MTHIEKNTDLQQIIFSSLLRRVIYFEVIIPITAYYLQCIAEYITLNLAFKYSYNCDATSYSA